MRLYEIKDFFEKNNVSPDHPLVKLYETMDSNDPNTLLSDKNVIAIVDCFRGYWNKIKIAGPDCILLYTTDCTAKVFYEFAVRFYKMSCFSGLKTISIHTMFSLLMPFLNNFSDKKSSIFLDTTDVSGLIYAPIKDGNEYVITVSEITEVIVTDGRVVHPYVKNKALELTVFSSYWNRINDTDRNRVMSKFAEQMSFCPPSEVLDSLHGHIKNYLVSVSKQQYLTEDKDEKLFQQNLMIAGILKFIEVTKTLGPEISSLQHFSVGSCRTFADTIDLLTRTTTDQIMQQKDKDILWRELILNLDIAIQGLRDISTYYNYGVSQIKISTSALVNLSSMRSSPLLVKTVADSDSECLEDDADHVAASYSPSSM